MKKLAQATDTFKELAIIYLLTISLFAILFSFAEHKTLIDSIWWAFVTAMTVGYGDIYPVTMFGRFLGIILMHVVPLFVVPLIVVRLTSKLITDSNQFSHDEQEAIKNDLSEIKSLLTK